MGSIRRQHAEFDWTFTSEWVTIRAVPSVLFGRRIRRRRRRSMPIPAFTRIRVAAVALLAGASALASLPSLFAQTPPAAPAAQGAQPTPPAPARFTDPMIQDLRWRNIGNANLVGRISSIDALESNWAHVIVGSAAGGVFKSVSGGVAWQPIFDQYGAASIGDVKINQTNPD